ncbi:hypothetical protein JTE90_013103 [Oedothorax gibbosus]|uniref:Uncharacterized protein n=1 Tax=Oedothorax gibbosus TaxID=931172 RepID=A0AAV6TVC8_9ARAC|nr:hypothetical protein JTE90_013103 [Oedothorax gibbosus]
MLNMQLAEPKRRFVKVFEEWSSKTTSAAGGSPAYWVQSVTKSGDVLGEVGRWPSNSFAHPNHLRISRVSKTLFSHCDTLRPTNTINHAYCLVPSVYLKAPSQRFPCDRILDYSFCNRPYQVLKRNNKIFTLQVRNKLQNVTIERLKPFFSIVPDSMKNNPPPFIGDYQLQDGRSLNFPFGWWIIAGIKYLMKS